MTQTTVSKPAVRVAAGASTPCSCPLGRRCPGGGLSPRLREVFLLLLTADGQKQAGAALEISPHTVHQHAKRLYARFGVSGRMELLALALRLAGELEVARPVASRKKHRVRLTREQRDALQKRVGDHGGSEALVLRARILLMADDGATDLSIAAALSVSVRTIERARRRFAAAGLRAIIATPQPARSRPRLLSADQARTLRNLARTEPPAGSRRWTLRLLAERMIALGHGASLSRDTVARALGRRMPATAPDAAISAIALSGS